MLCWYSIIHTLERDLSGIFVEVRRVLRPDGSLLLGFHVPCGERVAGGSTATPDLTAQLHDVQRVSRILTDCGFTVQTALERTARSNEKDAQGFLLATRG